MRANGVDYHFSDVSNFSFHSSGGDDTIELVDSTGDDTLVATPSQMILRGTPVGRNPYEVTADNFRYAHGYAKAGGNDTAEMVGSSRSEQLKVYADLVKLMGRDYYNRAKFFETVSVEMNAGNDSGSIIPSTGVDVLWAAKDEARLAQDIGLAAELQPSYERMAYDVTIRGCERLVARARGGNDWIEFHDSPLNDLLVAKPHRIDMMNGPRLVEDVMRGDEYRITAFGFGHMSAVADQGGNGDVAKLYDSGELGADIWAAGFADGQTWSTMSSPSRLLYEVASFEHVGGYGFNVGYGEDHGTNRKEHSEQVDFVFQYGCWEGNEDQPVPNAQDRHTGR